MIAAMGRVSGPVVAEGPIAAGMAVIGSFVSQHTPETGLWKQPIPAGLITAADYQALGAGAARVPLPESRRA
ncbi:MAG: hypothetical protein JWN52_6224 [Actinomycetia bacterium]|nr:hypothetical protein [Actinomycetes bacterium]